MTPPAHPQFFSSIGRFLTPQGWPSDYLVIDIETDSFGPKTIPLQVAWLQIRDRNPVPSESGSRILDWTRGASFDFMTYLKGRIDKTREMMEAKGLQYRFSMESIARDGIDPESAMLALHNAIWTTAQNNNFLVGYNHIQFDLPIIKRNLPESRRECVLKSSMILDLGTIEKARVHNLIPLRGHTLPVWHELVRCNGNKGKSNLDNARIVYGIDCDASKAHDAGQDCYDTHLLLEAMRPLVGYSETSSTDRPSSEV